MQDRIQLRLARLQQEYEIGERQLRELIQQEAGLRETLLRISGAIQVLQELLPDGEDAGAGTAAAGSGPAVLQVP